MLPVSFLVSSIICHKDKQTKWTSIEEDIQKLSQYGIGTQVTIDFINKTLILLIVF
jgi:hypothetical protein